MKLLTADTVKTDGDRRIDEQRERTRKLISEESDANASLNKVRLLVESESKRLNGELEDYRKEIAVKKASLDQEVVTLESRKRDALAPINEQKREADNRLALADRRERELDRREKVVLKSEKSINSERQSIADEKKATEKDLKNVANELVRKQSDIERQKNNLNNIEKSLSTREKRIDERELAITNKEQEVRIFIKKKEQKVQEELNKARKLLEISQSKKQ